MSHVDRRVKRGTGSERASASQGHRASPELWLGPTPPTGGRLLSRALIQVLQPLV